MAFTDTAVAVVEQTWQLSIEVVPYLFIASAVIYLFYYRDHDVATTLVRSQQHTTLTHGPLIAFGLLLGGLVRTGAPEAPAAFGLAVAGITAVYAYHSDGIRKPEELQYPDVASSFQVGWVLIPLMAIGAVVSGHVLVLHVLGLVFYGHLFWHL